MIAILVQLWLDLVLGTLILLHLHWEGAQVLLFLVWHFIAQESCLKVWAISVER